MHLVHLELKEGWRWRPAALSGGCACKPCLCCFFFFCFTSQCDKQMRASECASAVPFHFEGGAAARCLLRVRSAPAWAASFNSGPACIAEQQCAARREQL